MNKSEFQKNYFKFMYINYPTLSYNDILLIISEKYQPNKLYYSLKKFNTFKMNYKNNLKNKISMNVIQIKQK